MLYCEVEVRKGGSLLHTVPAKRVSVPEIRVLQAIHGADSVVNIRPVEIVKMVKNSEGIEEPFSHEDERQRLSKLYEGGSAMTSDEQARGLVARLFGAYGNLPTKLADIGIDPKATARKLREQAENQLRAAAALDEEPEDLVGDEQEELDLALEAFADTPEPVLEDDLV